MKAVILFGHGARNAEWAEPFHRIRAAMQEKAPEVRVELAFLELMRPTLDEAFLQLTGPASTPPTTATAGPTVDEVSR